MMTKYRVGDEEWISFRRLLAMRGVHGPGWYITIVENLARFYYFILNPQIHILLTLTICDSFEACNSEGAYNLSLRYSAQLDSVSQH